MASDVGQTVDRLAQDAHVFPVEGHGAGGGEAAAGQQLEFSHQLFFRAGDAAQPVVPAHAVKAHGKDRPHAAILQGVQQTLVDQGAVRGDLRDRDVMLAQLVHEGQEILAYQRLAAGERDRVDSDLSHLADDAQTFSRGQLAEAGVRRGEEAVAAAVVAPPRDAPLAQPDQMVGIGPILLCLRPARTAGDPAAPLQGQGLVADGLGQHRQVEVDSRVCHVQNGLTNPADRVELHRKQFNHGVGIVRPAAVVDSVRLTVVQSVCLQRFRCLGGESQKRKIHGILLCPPEPNGRCPLVSYQNRDLPGKTHRKGLGGPQAQGDHGLISR